MAINHMLLGHLGGHEEDLPRTKSVFRHLEAAGLDPDRLSRGTVLRCARVAMQERVLDRELSPPEAIKLYDTVDKAIVGPDVPVEPSVLLTLDAAVDSSEI